MFKNTFIPYGAYWSTPFCKWQGQFSHLNAVDLAAKTTAQFFQQKNVSPEAFDGLAVGFSVPQKHSLYAAPWVAGLIGAPGITGPIFMQACATSTRLLASSALEIEHGTRQCLLGLTLDRTSNSPHIYYPNPQGIGGKGDSEDWVWDSFSFDPYAKNSMIQTAENVAREAGITKEEQDQIALIRYAQYQDALKDDRAFQKRYLFAVTLGEGKKQTRIELDEGIFPTTAEGLAKLKPALDGGTVTFGTQTHPADGNAGIVLCNADKAKTLSRDSKITVQIVSFGEARTKKGFMAMAVVPAAKQSAERAGIKLEECKSIKTHNPFALNDAYFCKTTGIKPEAMNRYGSSIIWGHPQGPTGARSIIEMIEELVLAGGGYGTFAGCAAGDTAMALTIKVS